MIPLSPKTVAIVLAVLALTGMAGTVAYRLYRDGVAAEQLRTVARITEEDRANRAQEVRNDDAVDAFDDRYAGERTVRIEGQAIYRDRIVEVPRSDCPVDPAIFDNLVAIHAKGGLPQ